ncbi:MAG: inositol monophosphatase family protein, partial [Chloroflexota bacterium]
MIEPLSDYLNFAMETAWQAGRLTLGYFQTDLLPEFKSDATPVTIADRKAEELIRARIERRYPKHAIIGEEYGAAELEGATHRWYIDPIDGTRSFVRGVPMYAVLIGLKIEEQVEVGVAYFPALGEMLSAARGLGCRWNGRPARVSDASQLQEGLLVHSDASSFEHYGRDAAWQRLCAATGFRAGW